MNTYSTAKDNFDMLVDLEVILAFYYLVPMLEMVNKVIKWTQDRNIYVVDFNHGVKHCTSLLYHHFVDSSTRFQIDLSTGTSSYWSMLISKFALSGSLL
jgi:hypothetical protein